MDQPMLSEELQNLETNDDILQTIKKEKLDDTDFNLENLHHSIDIKEEIPFQECQEENEEEMGQQIECTDDEVKSSGYKNSCKSDLKLPIRKTCSEKKRFVCGICKYRCEYLFKLKMHMRIHMVEKPFSCKVCDFKCAYEPSLILHVKNSHLLENPSWYKKSKSTNPSSNCEIYDYKKRIVKHHMVLQNCELCNYKCLSKEDLESHVRSHTGEKPFACTSCDYKCADRPTLSLHINKTHEKPFSCELCHYKFILRHNLIAHMRMHSGENKFTCETCKYECPTEHELKQHTIKTHASEQKLKCEVVDYQKRVIKHNLVLENCKFCDFKCITKQDLIRHTRATHFCTVR